VEHVDADVADGDLIAMFQLAVVIELLFPVRIAFVRQSKPGARPLRQVAGSGNEVGVDVGFGDVGDPQIGGVGRIDVLPHIAVGIKDDGFAGGGAADQVTVLRDERLKESFDYHVCGWGRAVPPNDKGTCHIFTKFVNRLQESGVPS
jgi:hypothetical protein